MDQIEIYRLAVKTQIGVPDEERAKAQTVLISLWITPENSFDDLKDEIQNTTNYAQIASEVESIAAAKPRRLIETLATNITESSSFQSSASLCHSQNREENTPQYRLRCGKNYSSLIAQIFARCALLQNSPCASLSTCFW